jgi:hypothetical protein
VSGFGFGWHLFSVRNLLVCWELGDKIFSQQVMMGLWKITNVADGE